MKEDARLRTQIENLVRAELEPGDALVAAVVQARERRWYRVAADLARALAVSDRYLYVLRRRLFSSLRLDACYALGDVRVVDYDRGRISATLTFSTPVSDRTLLVEATRARDDEDLTALDAVVQRLTSSAARRGQSPAR